MEKELFDQLVESMEQMVAIEKGKIAPAAVHRHHLPDVKTIRAISGLTQGEFSDAVGVSPSLVQSWEQNRRVPSGSSLKLLLMLERNPALLKELCAI
ncbi:NadS family protein [Brenneria izbisi]|uniref:Helix-turn-helix domain-containing protein n=1 Tax=Brenneria izbisi TaxID=2939450 RepID=A0AA41Y201_9GAMM|nr:NadS family protein [Brenneria izbisi]MCV9877921.1 helix-turn-helix domain-containing protein [Brenneria izbisi]MCV9881515.1 helix-turn-helix domain-containing protein [Brenneria izbisi]